MMQRVLASKNLAAFVLACATGLTLFFGHPFPADDLLLPLIAVREPFICEGIRYCYTLFLFTTPYILFSLVLSGLYVFALRPPKRVKAVALPEYSDPNQRDTLFLTLGEVHDPRKPVPNDQPYWMNLPERGLFTGIAIFGAVGSGKTSGCMYPYAEQLIAYRSRSPEHRVGGLVLEVKGDFCRKVRTILESHDRATDYVEVNLNADYLYNPLYNDMDAYALAYNIASLLNNLFGKGKEPFWQQAYTNLVKFIILLHKVAFDYVTLFDVYECAIDPTTLEKKINEAERRLTETDSVLVSEEEYLKHPRDLEPFKFRLDEESKSYVATLTPGLAAVLKDKAIQWEVENVGGRKPVSPEKKEQLEAVKRWFNHDWRRIEPKLRSAEHT